MSEITPAACAPIIPFDFQITDVGLEAICYSLKDLEDVNLCETPIGERGVEALTSLNKLRVVNLNSTRVTMDAYCKLKVGLNILIDWPKRD